MSVRVRESEGECRKQATRNSVEQFMRCDLNSVVVPDKKVKLGTRYRLSALEMLHLKFLAECNSVDE